METSLDKEVALGMRRLRLRTKRREGEGGRLDATDRQTEEHQGMWRLPVKVATLQQSNGTDTRC